MSRKNRPRKRAQGLQCALMPGECFTSRAAAEEMRLTRQINVATGGMGQANYRVEKCACGRHHLITEQHWNEWNARKESP